MTQWLNHHHHHHQSHSVEIPAFCSWPTLLPIRCLVAMISVLTHYVTMYTDILRNSSYILSRDKTRLWSRNYSPIYFGDPNNGNLDLSLSRLSTFHFLLSYSKLNIIFVVVKSVCHVWLFCDPMDCSLPARLFCPWDFPGKNTRVDCHFLLQGIFQTQGSNPGLPHCRQTLYPLNHQGSPKLY